MTREEAIEIIRKEYLCVDRDCEIERSCGKCDLVMMSKEPILEAFKMAMTALEQPTIIRCKDCKFAHLTYDGEVKYCDVWFPDESIYMDGDEFCSAAERKNEDSSTELTDSSTETSTVSLAVFEQVKWERDVAIQQLKELGYGLEEKIRTDEDCISREAVLEIIRNEDKWLLDAKGHNADTEIAFSGMLLKVSDLPSVKPKERTGEWQQDMDGTYLCSECGSGYKDQPTLMGKPMFAFCPICGARMVESEDKG